MILDLLSSGASAASNIVIAVFAAVLTIGCIVWLIVALCKNAENEEKAPAWGKLAIILLVGFALRMLFAMFIRGYRGDYAAISSTIGRVGSIGLKGYYKGDTNSVLYPVVYLVYLIFGGLSNVTGLSDYALGMQFAVKLPLILADLATAIAVYLTAKRYFNQTVGIVLCAFVCFCPIFFIGSSVWCTELVFTAMFMCYACYFLARKKYACTIAFATAAAFSSKEGIYLFPIVAVFCVYHLVRAIKNIKKDGVSGKAVLGADYCAAITVPVGFVLSLVGAYLIGLFETASYNANFFVYIYEFLLAPLVNWLSFTANGLSVYAVFGRNGAAPGPRFPAWLFVCIFAAILIAVVCVVYFTKRNRATMVMLAAFAMFTMQVYYPGSTAQSALIALPVMLCAYALVKDKRILYVVFALGILYVINSIAVMCDLGQLNNLSDYDLDLTAAVSHGAQVLTLVLSVFAVLVHLYFTVITVNIGMTGGKKPLAARNGFAASVKEFFAVKKG